MTATFEIKDRFTEPGDSSELLYAPLDGKFSYRKTRRYLFEIEGDELELNRFVSETLVDPISQTMFGGDQAAVSDALFAIDYGMKPGALDLEKEAVVSYYKGLDDPGFTLNNLKIRQRVYVFSDTPGQACDPDIFIGDICNSAIHDWKLIRN